MKSFVWLLALVSSVAFAGPPEDFDALATQAGNAWNQGQTEQAIALHQKAIEIAVKYPGLDPLKQVFNLFGLMQDYKKMGQLDLAEQTMRRVVALLNSNYLPQLSLSTSAVYRTSLAEILLLEHQPDPAKRVAEDTINLVETTLGKQDVSLVYPLSVIGNAFLDQNNTISARVALGRALQIMESNKQSFGFGTISQYALQAQARLARLDGQSTLAEDFEKRATAVPTTTRAVTNVQPPRQDATGSVAVRPIAVPRSTKADLDHGLDDMNHAVLDYLSCRASHSDALPQVSTALAHLNLLQTPGLKSTLSEQLFSSYKSLGGTEASAATVIRIFDACEANLGKLRQSAQHLPALAKSLGPDYVPASTDFSSCKRPDYPRISLRYEEQGKVRLAFAVDGSGHVIAGIMLASSGSPFLDSAAYEALKACNFAAAHYADQTIPSWAVMEYVWKMP